MSSRDTSETRAEARLDDRRRGRGVTRRGLLSGATGWVLAGAGAALLRDRPASAASSGVAETLAGSWGEVTELADNVWAVESTPLAHRDFKTVCNGGIVAGSERVLVIEAFAGPAGARWVAEAALQLTGRWPTDVVVSHYHGDHTGGLTGFQRGGRAPRLHGTRATLDRLVTADDSPDARERQAMISSASIVQEDADSVLELGGGEAVFHPFDGHTASDLIVELPDRQLAFAGDLLWSGMIPNFVDARPIELSRTLRALRELGPRRYVPGHGALVEPRLLELNLELASFFEDVGRRSFEAGVGAADAAARTELPAPFDAWVAFSESYVERAIGAWHRALSPVQAGA